MRRYLAALFFVLALTTAALAQDDVIRIEVKGGKQGLENVPLTIPLSVPKEYADLTEPIVVISKDVNRKGAIGQLTSPGIMTDGVKPTKEGFVRRDLHVVLPVIAANDTRELVVHLKSLPKQMVNFGWIEKKGEYADLAEIWKKKGEIEKVIPVLRYMDRPYDNSSKDAREKSYKVFHHLYDPAGKRFVTNGGFTDDGATDPKKLLYPHHRGICYGFMKCAYGPGLKKKADTWHCTGDAHIAHEKTEAAESGPVLGRHRVLIGWHGEKNERFAEEERELTVYKLPGGTLVEFASRLITTGGPVKIDGDPQHAGFQFRAANEVADKKQAAQTYYLRPDGKGKLGDTRNWDPKTKKGPVDLPWDVLSFVLDNQRYSVCYMNHPQNPKESRFSERDYGRFGCYFEHDLTEKTPLVVHYRLWLQNGEMTQAQAEALAAAFAAPPRTMVK
jgi:hypothetical protein